MTNHNRQSIQKNRGDNHDISDTGSRYFHSFMTGITINLIWVPIRNKKVLNLYYKPIHAYLEMIVLLPWWLSLVLAGTRQAAPVLWDRNYQPRQERKQSAQCSYMTCSSRIAMRENVNLSKMVENHCSLISNPARSNNRIAENIERDFTTEIVRHLKI